MNALVVAFVTLMLFACLLLWTCLLWLLCPSGMCCATSPVFRLLEATASDKQENERQEERVSQYPLRSTEITESQATSPTNASSSVQESTDMRFTSVAASTDTVNLNALQNRMAMKLTRAPSSVKGMLNQIKIRETQSRVSSDSEGSSDMKGFSPPALLRAPTPVAPLAIAGEQQAGAAEAPANLVPRGSEHTRVDAEGEEIRISEEMRQRMQRMSSHLSTGEAVQSQQIDNQNMLNVSTGSC